LLLLDMSQVAPHAVQFDVDAGDVHMPLQQRPWLGHPRLPLQPGTQAMFEQSVPSAQSLSARHATHTCAAVLQTGVEPLQSALVLQPFVHVVPMQNWPEGQLSFVGKHWTHVLVVVSQRGFGAEQLESIKHCTQAPADVLHTCPVGQGCVAVQPGAQTFCLHTFPAAQSPSTKHATHVWFDVSHFGVGAEQSAFDWQPEGAESTPESTGGGAPVSLGGGAPVSSGGIEVSCVAPSTSGADPSCGALASRTNTAESMVAPPSPSSPVSVVASVPVAHPVHAIASVLAVKSAATIRRSHGMQAL
jgi:hypothetical protein